MLRAAHSTVRAIRRCLVSGRLALAIHSSAARLADQRERVEAAGRGLVGGEPVAQIVGDHAVLRVGEQDHVPVRFARSTAAWPWGVMSPCAVSRSTSSLLTLLHALRGLRGVKR